MKRSAAVTPHVLSAEAARLILSGGGNAVDAAVAAVAAQGVVAPETCGIGGDLFALLHRPGWDRPRGLNASGRSGSNADPEVLRTDGYTEVAPHHPLTVTIPGCVDGLAALSSEMGRLPLGDALSPAIDLATGGFEVSTEQARAFRRKAEVYRDNPAVSDFYQDGKPVERGDRVKRPSLAATLRAIAHEGRDAFYSGRPAEDIVAAVDGLITMANLEALQASWVEPIGVDVAGLTAWTLPPNSQGYLGPAALAVFEMLDPPEDPGHPEWWHLLIEAYRCLAWERDDLVADPEHTPLPPQVLLDRERLEGAASTVSREKAGVWPHRAGSTSSTAYLCVADGDGTAVSIIASNYRGLGSSFGAAGSGFLLQDRGGGFSLSPGHPNELAPNKRPLHTLSPTLWTRLDQPRWLLGTRGGAVQPQVVAQVGARAIMGGADLEAAQASPRWTITDFGPTSQPKVSLEPGVAGEVLSGLAARGHTVEELDRPQPGWGPVSIIEVAGDARRAAADPRVDTTAALIF